LLLPAAGTGNFKKSNANTENITNSPENVQNSNILPPEGDSQLPTVRISDFTFLIGACLIASWQWHFETLGDSHASVRTGSE